MNEAMTERMVCSKAHPYMAVGGSRDARWEHPDAVVIGEDAEDHYDPATDTSLVQVRVRQMMCPHCNLEFRRAVTRQRRGR